MPRRSALRPHLKLWALAGGLLLIVAGMAVATRPDALPDFRAFTAGPERKAEFFDFLRPLIESENARILRERRKLQALEHQDDIGWIDRYWLGGLASEYDIDTQEMDKTEIINALMRRVDVVPESLALAQAAKESGWGTSRFAREGNNLFGQRCFDKGCGIVPTAREQGLKHEVVSYTDPAESVGSYFHNINTHESYEAFRVTRAKLRASGQKLSGIRLAEDLPLYSERRRAYVDEIKSLIRVNGLADLDSSLPIPE